MKSLTIQVFSILILVLYEISPAISQSDFNQLNESATQKAVLVTGASTGIGRNITESLAENGYLVYAGARKQSDLDE